MGARRADHRLGAQGHGGVSVAAPPVTAGRQRLRRVLQDTPLFRDLDKEGREAVERELTLVVLPGGAPLFHPGEPADAVYVVTSGCLGVFRREDVDPASEPVLIAEITPGNLVG